MLPIQTLNHMVLALGLEGPAEIDSVSQRKVRKMLLEHGGKETLVIEWQEFSNIVACSRARNRKLGMYVMNEIDELDREMPRGVFEQLPDLLAAYNGWKGELRGRGECSTPRGQPAELNTCCLHELALPFLGIHPRDVKTSVHTKCCP